MNIKLTTYIKIQKFNNSDKLRRNPIENRAISGFSGQKSVPEQF